MFYDTSKDTATADLVGQLTVRKISAAEVMAAYEDAEPERQLCVLSILEVSTGENMVELKREAVERLKAKLGVSDQKRTELLSN